MTYADPQEQLPVPRLPVDLVVEPDQVLERAHAAARALSWVVDFTKQLVHNVTQALVNMARRVAPLTPDRAPDVSSSLMSTMAISAAGLGIMTAASSAMAPLASVGLGRMAAIIGDVTNYREISGQYMRAITSRLIGQPLSYQFNQILRPFLPSQRDGQELASRGLISPEQYRRLLEFYGYPDQWVDLLLELRHTPISAFLLPRLAAAGAISPQVALREAERRGYHPQVVQAIGRWIEMEAAGETRPAAIGAAIKLYREGWIDKRRLEQHLLTLGVPRSWLHKYLLAAELEFLSDMLSDRLSALKEAVRRGVMTPEVFEGTLLSLGMDPRRAAIHAEHESLRLLGRSRRTPTAPAPISPTPTRPGEQPAPPTPSLAQATPVIPLGLHGQPAPPTPSLAQATPVIFMGLHRE